MTLPRWTWAWLAVALLVRLALLVWSGHYVPFGDPVEYDQLGRSLADHGHYTASLIAEPGTPSAYRPPGYPYWLAGIYVISGNDFTAARVAGALLGVVTVLLVWLIARRMAGERIARVAIVIAALAPSLAWVSGGLVAETTFLPLMLGGALAVLRFRASPAGRLALGAGLLIGFATLTRTNGLILVVPFALGVWQARRGWRDVALLAVGVALALAPWTVRNLVVLDTFAPLGTQTGVTLVGVLNQDATESAYFGVFRPPEKIPVMVPYARVPGVDEVELDRRARSAALEFAGDHLGYVRALVTHHLQQLFELRDVEITSANSQHEMAIPSGLGRGTARYGFLALLLGALAGGVAARRVWWRREHVWLWLVPVALLVSVVLTNGGPRYRLPLDPFFCVLAAGLWPAIRAWLPSGSRG